MPIDITAELLQYSIISKTTLSILSHKILFKSKYIRRT